MRLNEDYFDDLKLTDKDIESSDDNYNTNHNTDDYANPKEYYNAMSSKYNSYMFLGIKGIKIDTDNDILTDSELWTDKIPRMLKKLFYLFDLYEIEYSKPVVSEPDYYIHDFIQNIQIEINYCNFFDFYGYKLFLEEEKLEDYQNDELSVLLFFNPPKTQSYTAACKFVGNMMKTLWRNEDYDTFVDSICVYNFMPDIGFNVFNPYTTEKINNIDKTSIVKLDQKIIDIINLFFPYDDNIEEELIKNKQLLLKVYKCFPDY